MACSNCFNGCDEITSDQCVKYTGVDIEALNIHTGDPLSQINSSLTTFLLSALDGTGIVPDIDATICNLVQKYLPNSPTLNIIDILSALIQAACDLQAQVDLLQEDMDSLNTAYSVSCLTGVDSSSDTHSIVQAIITKLCSVSSNVTAIISSLSLYVRKDEIDSYIAAYLASLGQSTKMKYRMVPYVAVEFYGNLTGKFDISGVGIVGSDWEDIYLCNGDHGTPDKRGRIPVGVTEGIGGPSLAGSSVEPGVNSNPFYNFSDTYGSNFVTLLPLNMPVHTHVATPTITDPTHFHYEFSSEAITGEVPWITNLTYPASRGEEDDTLSYRIKGSDIEATIGKSSLSSTGISATVLNANAGGDVHHLNVPPVLACYYIMYIP